VTNWIWIELQVVLAVHDRLLADYGGLDGIRDMGALEGALGRPPNLAAYGEPDTAELAALYAAGIAKAHGFVDGNKRAAWTISQTFLERNGLELEFDELEVVLLMLQVANGETTLEDLAVWFRQRFA
jgi:death on curing protein